MKRIFFLVICTCVLNHYSNAQQKKNNDQWKFYAGPTLSMPLKYLHNFSTLGLGLSAAGLRSLAKNVSGGGRVSYDYFFGKNISGFGKVSATGILNILAEGRYDFENGLGVGVNLGLGMDFYEGQSDKEFAYMLFLSYQLQAFQKACMLAACINLTEYQKFVGVRFNIPLN